MEQCDNWFWFCRSLLWKLPGWIDSLTLNWPWEISPLENDPFHAIFGRFGILISLCKLWNRICPAVQILSNWNKKAFCLFLLIVPKVKAVYRCRLYNLTRTAWKHWTYHAACVHVCLGRGYSNWATGWPFIWTVKFISTEKSFYLAGINTLKYHWGNTGPYGRSPPLAWSNENFSDMKFWSYSEKKSDWMVLFI